MKNILITGSDGQLGCELKIISRDYDGYAFTYTNKSQLDITNHSEVNDFIISNRINIIINCAAYTAVDNAENQLIIADKINHLAVKNLADISKNRNIQLIHISTDYVFDGENFKPYSEIDDPNPQSVYGKSKLAGEVAIRKINPPNSIIIRTSWVYSNYGKNFLKTMISLSEKRDEISVVVDQIGTPTCAADLAETILTILPKIKNKVVDLVHYSNEGACSWFDFSLEIYQLKSIKIKVNPIESVEFKVIAKRPYYSVLNKKYIKEKYKIEIPHWKNSLTKTINT
jgi:dTDP-4-dehydrorhamnose reductase